MWPAAGTAVGKLVEVDSIQPGAIEGENINDDVVLLVKNASGDEEVGATGLQLKGVILQHSLPHLSHLGECSMQCLVLRMYGLMCAWRAFVGLCATIKSELLDPEVCQAYAGAFAPSTWECRNRAGQELALFFQVAN